MCELLYSLAKMCVYYILDRKWFSNNKINQMKIIHTHTLAIWPSVHLHVCVCVFITHKFVHHIENFGYRIGTGMRMPNIKKKIPSQYTHTTYIEIAMLRRCNWTFILIAVYVCSFSFCLFSTHIRTTKSSICLLVHSNILPYSFTQIFYRINRMAAEFTEYTIVFTRVQSRFLCRLFVRAALLCITLNISLHSWFLVREKEEAKARTRE